MPEDLETLLRDAGHGPTRALDVDVVHAAGRRRARTRTFATGVSVLALLGVAVVGVNGLLPDTPDAPFVDQVPPASEQTPGPEPAPTDDAQDHQDDEDDEAPEGTAPDLGTTTARVSRDPDAGLEVTLSAPDGTTTLFSTGSRASGDLAGSVVLDGEGRAVIADATGDLVRSGPDGSTVLAGGDAQAGTPWSVHGTTDEGEVLVSRSDPSGNDVLQVVRGDELVPWTQPVEASLPEERFLSATAVGDRLLVTLVVGDSVRWLLYDADAAPVEVLTSSTMPFDDVPTAPALVGDELWHLETRASDDPDGGGPQDLILRDGDELLRVPTPYGRDLDAFVGAVSVGQMADGGSALLLSSIARDRSGPGVALLVDLDAARAATTASGGDEIPDGVFTEQGASAHVLFAP